jgi:hypothetical protein
MGRSGRVFFISRPYLLALGLKSHPGTNTLGYNKHLYIVETKSFITLRSGSSVYPWQGLPASSRISWPGGGGKQSSLLQTFAKCRCRKFYNIGALVTECLSLEGLTYKHYTKVEKPAGGKYCTLLETVVNYGSKNIL